MILDFKCPYCGVKLNANEKDAGKESQCAFCKKTFKIPHYKSNLDILAELAEQEVSRPLLRSSNYMETKKYRKRHDKVPNRFILCFISFLIPILGLLVGIYLLTKSSEEDRKTGGYCLVCTIAGFFIGLILGILLGMA